MDLRHFEHYFQSQTLHQAFRWLKKNQVRKLPHEYSVGEAQVKIKTNAHVLVNAACTCGKARCVHLAVVLLFRQGLTDEGAVAKRKTAGAFQKSITKFKSQDHLGAYVHLKDQQSLADKLAYFFYIHLSKRIDQDIAQLISELKKKPLSDTDEEVWRDAALHSLKTNNIDRWTTSVVFALCVRHLKSQHLIEEVAERIRAMNPRRYQERRQLFHEMLIQRRIILNGKKVQPTSGIAAIAWCSLQINRSIVKAKCKQWLQLPLEDRLGFAHYCRERFSDDPVIFDLSLYVELVSAPIINFFIWNDWINAIPDNKKAENINKYLQDIAGQPSLVKLAKRLFVFANLGMFNELAREMRHPDATFSMIHEVMTPVLIKDPGVRRSYLLSLDKALLLSSGSLKRLIRQRADQLLESVEGD